jgi:hypothetical protein
MPKHANDNVPSSGQAIPIAIRLARAGRTVDLERLIEYGRVPTSVTWLSAEGNLPEVGSKPQADRVTEIKPNDKGEMERIVKLMAEGKEAIKTNAKGHITHWIGADGRFRPVAELYRQAKGKRRKSEQERQDDNARHLAIRGSGGFPERCQRSAVPSEGEDFRRLRAAHWAVAMGVANDNARADIDRAGAGTGIDFDAAWSGAGLYPACRIPRHITVIARGAEFLAYRIHSNPCATPGSFVGAPDAVENQIIATIDAPRVDAALGEHAQVLDMSIAGKTAREIASESGFGNTKAGERRAVKAQDAALMALASLEEKLAA